MSEFAFVILTRDLQLAVYHAGGTTPSGSHPIAIVDLLHGTWTGYVPYPYTASQIDALITSSRWEGNDLCEAVRGRPWSEPVPAVARP